MSNRKIQKIHFRIERIQAVVSALLLSLLFTACDNTKYLQKGQQLYLGAKINLETDGKVPNKDQIMDDLNARMKPKPNQTILGFLRPQLWFYNIAGTPKGKGLRYFLKNKLGKPPVLFEQVDPDANADLFVNYLQNHGFFQPRVNYEVIPKGDKKIKLKYTVNIRSPYRYNIIEFPPGDSAIAPEIMATKDSSLLKTGDPYSLDQLKLERERVETAVKNRGYFYFTANDLIFKVDSTIGNRQVNVYLRLKPNLPLEATRKYSINNVFIYTNYSIGPDSMQAKTADTTLSHGYTWIGSDQNVRHKVIGRSIFLKPKALYTREQYDMTLNRLMGLGVYKFVNIRFEEVDSTGPEGKLNMFVYLTPMPKKVIRTELRAFTQSDNFAGPELNVSFRNRNFLRGAELFTLNLHGSFETLLSNTRAGVNMYELGGDASLDVPRFIVPFNVGHTSSRFVPRTRFGLGYTLTNRVQYFLINDFNARAGYVWQENLKKQHELFPITVTYYQLSRTTDAFRKLVKNNEMLQRSFANQFILGSSYSYTYNELAETNMHKIGQFYFKGTVELSGNIAYLINTQLMGKAPIADTPFTIFGSPFAQYSRLSTDLRYYINFTPDRKLIFRVAPGVGLPYGNSSAMPYAKLFFEGGNNSVRAFQPRTLGPGTYDYRKDESSAIFLGEGGDMRLESNIEYRFNYTGIFNGAFFFDAGNTWLTHKEKDRPGSEFHFNDFYKQLAMGTGTGLRVDASFFVLRFDVAYPLHKPYLPEGQRWINLGQPEWDWNDIVFNLAIGYPF